MDNGNNILNKYLRPIQPLLDNKNVTDIFVNSYNCIYYLENFKKLKHSESWKSDGEFQSCVQQLTRNISFGKETTRVNISLGKAHRVFIAHGDIVSDSSPIVAFRRKGDSLFTFDQYKEYGTLNEQVNSLLVDVMSSNSNILISGQTGSGKTSLLNYLFSLTDPELRIVTFENIQEIILKHTDKINIVQQELTNPISSNAMDVQQNTLRAIMNEVATRVRPDKVIVGEINNGDSATAFMQSLNLGAKGSASTTHADSPIASIERVALLVAYEKGNFDLDLLKTLLLQKLDYIIQMDFIKGHGIKILDISKVNNEFQDGGEPISQIMYYDMKTRDYVFKENCY